MKLPEHFVTQHLNDGMTMMMFGVPVEELSRDELIASLSFAMKQVTEARESHSRSLRFFESCRRAR